MNILIFIGFVLFLSLVLLRALSKGPTCPECKSNNTIHFTESFGSNNYEYKHCNKCRHQWDVVMPDDEGGY